MSPVETKKFYRTKAKSLHPDKNQSVSAEKEFQELSEAYIVLSSSHKIKEVYMTRERK